MSTEIHVCCGVGGAGKTTTAAALAVGLARAGRRVVVLTIDPARRLADALGLASLGNTPRRVPLADAPGRLDALMLDRKATWDEVVRRYAPSDEVADRLLANPYYGALSTHLTGGHEYMATEKLYALAHDGTWDTVVVDTPPSQHALDFFQAPARIRRILDQRLLAAWLAPSSGVVGAATRRVVDVVRRLAGEAVMDDLTDFFTLVRTLSSGFRERGAEVHALLHAPSTHYWLVANATHPRDADLFAFLEVLRGEDQHFAGFFLNRTTSPLPVDVEQVWSAWPAAPEGVAPTAWQRVGDAARGALTRRARDAERDARTASRLAKRGRAAVWPVPDVQGGVADLAGLEALSAHLPPAVTSPAGSRSGP